MRPLGEITGTLGVGHLPRERMSADSSRPAQQPRHQAVESWPVAERYLGLSNEELRRVDPVVLNLTVARGIPSLASLDIARYVRLADEWAADIRRCLPSCEANFYKTPERWGNDIDISRLAVIGWYVGEVLKIGYREDQKHLKWVYYTDPTDLFLNGVMDTRRGTCGNMAMLWVVLAQRLGWPLHLATVGPHFICRFDDGKKVINIDAASEGGTGDWSSPPDSFYLHDWGDRSIPQRAVDCGSDLRALTPREMLGVFFGLRARHRDDADCFMNAEPDYLAARYLFPRNRYLYIRHSGVSVYNSMELFDAGERGHPTELSAWLREIVQSAPWLTKRYGANARQPNQSLLSIPSGESPRSSQEKQDVSRAVDAVFQAMCRKPK